MLKWAVNNPNRPSQQKDPLLAAGDTGGISEQHKGKIRNHDRRRLRRKSSGNEMTNIRRKILNRDKENNLTSTPLPLHRQSLSPLRQYDSLRDLSNIPIASEILSTPIQTPRNFKANSTIGKNNPLQYATTLPTFDAEYSPCSLVPGPMLALRGIGIADSYFEKPRYLSNNTPQIQNKRPRINSDQHQPHDVEFQVPQHQPLDCRLSSHPNNGDESLSSSRMGDMTLDRMIDAILESARKDRRNPKVRQQSHPVMSPTYTRAEDPASDLNEIWHPINSNCPFNEREVRTPDSFEDTIRNSIHIESADPSASCHLRRQRVVRRKRKHVNTGQEVDQASAKNSIDAIFANNSLLRKSFDELVEMDTPKGYNDLSPDSGRNSASDLEESGEDHCTRRRLSFSPNLPEPKFKDKDKVG
ncbi:unnamed protein product [Hermetia illucens]|uniref:Uncharacterized protein n=1 Tax=Hermetia illucens TaxID=343691 RepID=A0A7R8YW93_HERIL|nr:unnamed protein product [Hermetia illucens]